MCGRIRAAGHTRTISVLALLIMAAALAMAGTASATPLDYPFTDGNQGWQQTQDQASGPTGPAGFLPSGGNPGGRLTAKDSGSDSGCPHGTPCRLLTFYSPFVNQLGGNYGGTGSFDLRSSVNPFYAAELLLLPEGPNYLDGLVTEDTGTVYNHLSIQLDETARWFVCPYLGGTCLPPSQAEFKALIAASDVIAVMVDVGPNMTGETYDLDNVGLTDGSPQPTPPPPQPAKKAKKCKKKHKRAAAAKKGKCKKKKKQKKKHKRRVAPLLLRG